MIQKKIEMSYRKSTIKIFRDLVESMTFPIDIRTIVTDSDGNYVLYVCDIYHAQPNFTVEINAETYTIVAIDSEENTITLSGAVPIIVTSFELYKPFFFYGTPTQTNMELSKESQVNIKHVPMVYMIVPFDDVDQNDISPITKTISGDLFFLTQSNNLTWLNEQAFDEGVMPMRRLAENLVQKMIETISVFDILPDKKSFKMKDYPKFGVQIQGKGVNLSYWNDNLSGCSMRIESLGIWDDGKCDVCLPPILPIESSFDSSFDNSFS